MAYERQAPNGEWVSFKYCALMAKYLEDTKFMRDFDGAMNVAWSLKTNGFGEEHQNTYIDCYAKVEETRARGAWQLHDFQDHKFPVFFEVFPGRLEVHNTYCLLVRDVCDNHEFIDAFMSYFNQAWDEADYSKVENFISVSLTIEFEARKFWDMNCG